MRIPVILLIGACLCSVLLADGLVFDRGLPTANLNNAAGGDRSNVAWGDGTPSAGYNWAIGDDFSFGVTGQSYQITDLQVWIVGDASDPLSSIFSSLTLSGGLPGTTASTSSACSSTSGGPQGFSCLNASGISDISTVSTDGSDPNVSITDLGADYQGQSGDMLQLFQVDFTNLNWIVQGGALNTFFVSGVPVTVGGNEGASPFLAASNAALSGSEQDGADGLAWELAENGGGPVAMDQWNSLGNGWDKSSDIDVEIFATPEPTSILLFGTMMLLVGCLARRKYQGRRQL